jgi:DNA-binding response OmpR family regulator
MNRIAIISENIELKERLKEYLAGENYIISFPSLDEVNEGSGNIIIFDLPSLEDLSGLNLKHEFDIKTVPVIAVLNNAMLPGISISTGIDDFILDDISAKALILRLKLTLWKHYGINTEDVIQIHNLIIDLAQHKVLVNYNSVDLTYMEFKLLQFLVSNKNRVFSRNHILERVWGYDYYGGARTVDVHVRRLRSKLGPKYGLAIETVRNVGYKFSL